jgi:K+/H+ antiporter YhaU regulatory subunit KhtT
VSVVAIVREGALIGNPGPEDVIRAGDRVAVIGSPEQLPAAEALLSEQ